MRSKVFKVFKSTSENSKGFSDLHLTSARARKPARKAAEEYVAPLMIVFVALLCLWAIWHSAKLGVARQLSENGVQTGSLPSVDAAVNLNAADPEIHFARASVLSGRGEFDAAAQSFQTSISLRPRDYFLWLELARVRDLLGDTEGAFTAFRESVRLAPFYAPPRWHLGNFILREGRTDEAFAELRKAASRDRALWRPIIELAWGAYDGNAAAMQQALRPQTHAAYMTFARFLIRHGRSAEGLELYRAANSNSDKDRHNIITDLLATQRFGEATELLRDPGVSARSVSTVINAMLEAGRVDEAAAVASETEAPEKDRRAILIALLENKRYGEAARLLRAFKESSIQERRLVLKGLLASSQLKEAVALVSEGEASERERQDVLKALISSKMFAEAIELLRSGGGNNEQQWRAVLSELAAARNYDLAIELLRASGGVPERDRRNLFNSLFADKRYQESYAVWLTGRGSNVGDNGAGITDGGFEVDAFDNQPGFGWRLPRNLQEVRVSFDTAEHREGNRSLRLDWSGDVKPISQVVSQLAIVKPKTRYRLSFAATTRDVVSAGLPIVTVADARPAGGFLIAQSEHLSEGTSEWRNYTVDFISPVSTTAVLIAVQRQQCPGTRSLCPIFGSLWLDQFTLREL